MDADERLRRYAELAVRVGANIQPGQRVGIWAQVEHAPVARAVASEAYRAGASHVYVQYNDRHVRKASIEYGPTETLGETLPYVLDWIGNLTEDGSAFIQLTGDPTPTLFADLDQELVGASEPTDFRRAWLPHVMNRGVNWTIVSAPNVGWAHHRLRRAGPREASGRRSRRRPGSTSPTPSLPGASTSRA